MEGKNGVFSGLKNKAIWIEMSTNDQSEILRLERIANDKGSGVLEAPVSGGCHAPLQETSLFLWEVKEATLIAPSLLSR